MKIFRKLVAAGFAVSTSIPTTAIAAEDRQAAPEGWPMHFESLITLAVVLTAIAIAWCLNHARPKMRAMGTFLAALSCFGVVLWFVGAFGTGFIENPKEFQTPMDAAKPALLWLQTGAAMIGGLALLAIANRQRKQTYILDLPKDNEADRYGRFSRF